jgi:hypothetical protein
MHAPCVDRHGFYRWMYIRFVVYVIAALVVCALFGVCRVCVFVVGYFYESPQRALF